MTLAPKKKKKKNTSVSTSAVIKESAWNNLHTTNLKYLTDFENWKHGKDLTVKIQEK